MQHSHTEFSSPSAQAVAGDNFAAPIKPASLKMRLEEARQAQQIKLQKLNEQISVETLGGKLIPFFLINGAAWRGDMGKFLMLRLNLLPFDSWNVMYLAEDEAMAFVMDCPAIQHVNAGRCEQTAMQRCHALKDYLDGMHRTSEQTGDIQAFADAKAKTRNQVRGLAAALSNDLKLGWQRRKSAMGIQAAGKGS